MINANSRQRLKRLKPRQRKKLRVGEFQELGFTVIANLKEDIASSAYDGLLDAWLDIVEQQGVSFGGHFSDGQLDGIVFPVNGVAVTTDILATLNAWLSARAEVSNVECSELLDVWHSAW